MSNNSWQEPTKTSTAAATTINDQTHCTLSLSMMIFPAVVGYSHAWQTFLLTSDDPSQTKVSAFLRNFGLAIYTNNHKQFATFSTGAWKRSRLCLWYQLEAKLCDILPCMHELADAAPKAEWSRVKLWADRFGVFAGAIGHWAPWWLIVACRGDAHFYHSRRISFDDDFGVSVVTWGNHEDFGGYP